MGNQSKTRAERETIIRRAADESDWEVFSEDPRIIRKMEKLWGKGHQDHQSTEGYVWTVPSSGVSLRKPRVLSEEQRDAAVQRLAEARKSI